MLLLGEGLAGAGVFYGVGKGLDPTVLVLDFGGGTFEVSIL